MQVEHICVSDVRQLVDNRCIQAPVIKTESFDLPVLRNFVRIEVGDELYLIVDAGDKKKKDKTKMMGWEDGIKKTDKLKVVQKKK